MSDAANRHGTVVLAADRGVMIIGASGSGKTTLALALIAHCHAVGLFARLVADDQVFATSAGARAIVAVPPAIAGKIEAYGQGPTDMAHEPRAVVDLVVDLVAKETAPRFGADATRLLDGVRLPCLCLAERNARAGVLAVAALLHLPPFR